MLDLFEGVTLSFTEVICTDWMCLPSLRFTESGSRSAIVFPWSDAVSLVSRLKGADSVESVCKFCPDVDSVLLELKDLQDPDHATCMKLAKRVAIPPNSVFFLPSGYVLAERVLNNAPCVGIRMPVFVPGDCSVKAVLPFLAEGGVPRAALEMYCKLGAAASPAPPVELPPKAPAAQAPQASKPAPKGAASKGAAKAKGKAAK